MICNARYFRLKTLYLPYIIFKRLIESVFRQKENLASRELNPDLLLESLTPLSLDHQGFIKKFEKKNSIVLTIFLCFCCRCHQVKSFRKALIRFLKFLFSKMSKDFNQSIKKLCFTGFGIRSMNV